jgi:hypothetical protein
LVDGGSSADIIFTSTINAMKIYHKMLGRSEHPLYGFSRKKIHSMGRIILPVSFGTVSNARTKQIVFDVVDMYYPYNTLFRRGTLNAFEAVISYSYLCMKMPAINGVITVHGDQTEVGNIEKEYTPGQKNVHAVVEEEEKEEIENVKPQTKAQACEETKRVPLDPLVPDKQVIIGTELSQEEDKLVEFLRSNKDIFAWPSNDLGGVSRDIIEHKLDIDRKVKPKKQKLRKLAEDIVHATKAEVQTLLDAKVIREVQFTTWLTNIVMVRKKYEKWRMCINFTDLNKACPEDNFPLSRIDTLVDQAGKSEMLSFLDYFSGYHQIWMRKEDEEFTSFITLYGTYYFVRMAEGLRNAGTTFVRITSIVLHK